jgi:hypothetical protein
MRSCCVIAELGRTCLSAFAVFDEQYQCMETASGYKAIHKIHYTRLTKRALQIPVGHTHQMNLNLSHSAEGILSIVHRKRTHEHAISHSKSSGRTTVIRERETRTGKEEPQISTGAQKSKPPSIGKKHKIEMA